MKTMIPEAIFPIFKKVALASITTTFITLSFTLLPSPPAQARCTLNEQEAQIRERYNGRYAMASRQYNALQAIPIAVDIYFFGGVISSEWAKRELAQVGIDAATFLANSGFAPSKHELIGDIATFRCNAGDSWPFDQAWGPNIFKPYIAIRDKNPQAVRDVAAVQNPINSVEERFRAVNDWAGRHGYGGGFPNFHQADPGSGVVYGTILLKPEAVEGRDIPASELGNPRTIEERFRAVNDWAGRHGYGGGFPNFYQADPGSGVVYGTILLKPEAVEGRDIPASELGNPRTIEERFRAVNDWAGRHGYGGGFPNFHQADYGQGVVYGVILLKPEAVEGRDIPVAELR